MLVAAAMPLVVGAAAISIDTINVTLARRQLQRAADSAALAGAHSLVQSASVNSAVNADLNLNNQVTLAGAPTIENAPTVGSYAGNGRAVRVVLTANRTVPFISFFGWSQMNVTVEATAAIVHSGEFCVIALETEAVTGITFGGNTTADLGCGVASNASGPASIYAYGSSRVAATSASAVGQIQSNGGFVGQTTFLPYSPVEADPYASISDPVVPNPCSGGAVNVQPNQTRTLTPGCYTSIDIKGTATFSPGTYIIDGGELSFGATAVAAGAGVTFVLTSRNAATNPASIASLSMHGGAELNFSAPDDGPYRGIIFYQDRRAAFGEDIINGNTASRFEGGFYFPSRQLRFNGNTGMRTECLQLVARRVLLTGNSRIQNTCPADGGAQAFDATMVRLVG